MTYDSVREALPITGRTVVDVTCDDWDEVCAEYPNPADRITRIYLHLDDGSTVTFHCSEEIGFCYDGYPDSQDSEAA